jgi:hypothetical protein
MRWPKLLLFICLFCACLRIPITAAQPATAKSLSAPLSNSSKLAAFVYINGTKYRLLQRYPDYWVLYDMQLSQTVHLLNQLVVTGEPATAFLRKYLKDNKKVTVSEIAAATYLLTGSVAALMQAEQQLKTVHGIPLEWQIRYLPLKSAAER